ncbi:PorT family protein [Lunatimonas sp.]|uniref:PorT family protein n=1 Tax=Lunatimonas sp. TaxID=2060141 RepID=UPI00263AC81B|nr:PorT family protein [Lunatimonas sp.]
MKKYLIAIILMVLYQQLFAFQGEATDKVMSDSIIVQFGRSGKLVFVIDNPKDFERLQQMDVNQIIRELELTPPETEGDQTVVEIKYRDGKKEIVRVYEGPGETEVTVGRYRLIVDESGSKTKVKFESDPKVRKDPAFRTYFTTDLGINTYFEEGSIPSPSAPYSVKGWGSWNVNLNWMASQKIAQGAYLDFGLGVHWYNFKFNNTQFQPRATEFGVDFLPRPDVNGFKNKISASYLTAMTLLKYDFGKKYDKGREGLRVGIGPYAGYRLGGRSKFVYRELEGSGRRKIKEGAGPYLNNFRAGIRGEVGFRSVTFFTTYDFSQLFHPGLGPEVRPMAFGITF